MPHCGDRKLKGIYNESGDDDALLALVYCVGGQSETLRQESEGQKQCGKDSWR